MTEKGAVFSSAKGVIYGLVLPLVLVAAVLGGYWISRISVDQLDELNPSTEPVTVAVEVGPMDYAAPAQLTLRPVAVAPVRSSGLSGRVTSVFVAPGETVAAGDPVYAVDTVTVSAYTGDTILYRPLSSGDQGDDVRAAQEVLNQVLTDRRVIADGVFGTSTEQAVRAFERRIGLDRPSGTLRPEWFVHLPTDRYAVTTVQIEPGTQAPPLDEPMIAAEAAVGSAGLVSQSDGPDGEYEFISQGRSIPVELDDGEWIVDATATPDLLTEPLPADSETVLEGRTRMIDGVDALMVPGGAVITDAGGSTCVATGPSSADLVAMTVIGSTRTGQAQIEADLDPGSQVLLNPYAVLGDLTCP